MMPLASIAHHAFRSEDQFLASGARASKLTGCTRPMDDMYKPAAVLIACSLLTHAGAWPPDVTPAGSAMLAPTALIAGSASMPVLFAQETTAHEASTSAGEAPPAEESGSLPMAQQIVAGALTGMLAAILTLRIVFRRRRKKDAP